MLEFYEDENSRRPGRPAKKACMPISAGRRDWRSQMPATDVERFEAAVGNLLDELHYARLFPSPSVGALARADRLREQFMRGLVSGAEVSR
jgi:hypothetical protein